MARLPWCAWCTVRRVKRRGNETCGKPCSLALRHSRQPDILQRAGTQAAVAHRARYAARVRVELEQLVPRQPSFTRWEVLGIAVRVRGIVHQRAWRAAYNKWGYRPRRRAE